MNKNTVNSALRTVARHLPTITKPWNENVTKSMAHFAQTTRSMRTATAFGRSRARWSARATTRLMYLFKPIGYHKRKLKVLEIDALLSTGANPNAIVKLSSSKVPLMTLAARCEDPLIIQRLITAGGNVNAKDENRRTVLMYACKYGHDDVVRILVAAGAAVNAKDADGSTALVYAIQGGHTAVVKTLIAAGADVNAIDLYGTTALIHAIDIGHIAIVEILLAAGANPNFVTSSGETALVLAVTENHYTIVRKLLAAGANVNLQENSILSRVNYFNDGRMRAMLIRAQRNAQRNAPSPKRQKR